jgi:hypothetical protein
MPNLPISQLPAASLPLEGNELFATVQGGITKYSTLDSIKYIPGNNYGLFNQTGASTPITNTITETSLLGGGVGTLSIPANGFNIGDAFHVISTGHISAVNNHTLRIRIKAGSILLADTGEITMSTATDRHWKLEIFFSINNIGAAGVASISTGGTFMYVKNASVAFEGSNFSTENNSTFDTTINNTLVVTAQWSNANSGDSIYSDIFTLTKTY